MSDFTVTDKIVAQISEQYNMPKKLIENLRSFYVRFVGDMKQQYLAHIIRTMEEQLRIISGNSMFRIVCSPVDKTSKEFGIAKAQYYKKRFFAIYYHPNTDEKQLRVLLAHELGHLFLIEMVNSTFGKQYDETAYVEPSSTVFGILAILDKNEFYHNKTTTYMHKSPDEVLNDFYLLHNRSTGKLNIS
jgi:hypothetical protein